MTNDEFTTMALMWLITDFRAAIEAQDWNRVENTTYRLAVLREKLASE
ncbi:MAG: hypothetical protein ABSC64_02310 [Candidatus Korobacteraceae bacterium]